MDFYNLIPGMNGYKALVGSYVQMICGLLLAIVELLKAANDCLSGATAISICINTLPVLFMGVVAAGNGLAQLGLAHKLKKLNEPANVTITSAQ